MPLEEFEQECNGEVCNDEEVLNDNVEAEMVQFPLHKLVKIPLFMRIFQQIMTDTNASKYILPTTFHPSCLKSSMPSSTKL